MQLIAARGLGVSGSQWPNSLRVQREELRRTEYRSAEWRVVVRFPVGTVDSRISVETNCTANKETAMSKHSSIRSIVSTSVCALCSTLALSPVFAADFPAGSYKAHDLSLVFDGNGQFHVDNVGTTVVSGTYSVKQGRVELTDVKGPWACKGSEQQKGTYVWTFNGAALMFIKEADSCDERSKTLVPASWQLQK
jgi:hypothetical protein